METFKSLSLVRNVALKYEIKHENKPYGNISSHPMPQSPKQSHCIQAEGNSELGNIGEA
jgi:hypothetical protein